MERYPATRFVQVALRWDRTVLDERIEARYEHQLAAGFMAEVLGLAERPLSATASHALGYRELLAHGRGELSLDEAVAAAVQRTRRFARRQERWFRRDPRILWVDAPVDADEIIDLWDGAIQTPVG
jgi:tRNA dimethylallyltransferase